MYKVEAADNGRYYALKNEEREPNRDHYKLFMETQVNDWVWEKLKKIQMFFLQVLRKAANDDVWQRYFPAFYDQCTGRRSMFIVMSLLGESLADIKRSQPNRVFR